MIENAKIDPPTKVPGTTLNTGSVPSCLRNDNGTCRKKPLYRRVSFPKDDEQIVTGFLEPADPWEYADSVDKEELGSIYILSCKKHAARPLSPVLNQIQNLDFNLERNECFSLKGEFLGPSECETLEEILKRVQFSTINLEATCLDDEASVAMFDMMEYYESATRLNIAGNHAIGVRGWQACSHMIKRTKCLEELDARNTTLNEQYMPILSRALRLSTQLHVLKLENCNLSGRPIIILAAALKLNTALKELYLGENYLAVNDAVQLSALLKVNSTLQLLDISNNNIQDAGLGHLSEGLSEQNNSGSGLAVLVVWNNRLTRNSSPHLARVLKNSKTLEMLNVGQNVLSNEVLHITKDALQKNKTLLRLGMQSTHLTCEGAVALAEIIADNSVIQRIDLRDNNLQVAGLMALALSMKFNMNVTQLDLDDTPRRKHSMGASLDEYVRLVAEIRGFCQRNETVVAKSEVKLEDTVVTETEPIATPERRSRLGSFASRKISLTCETLMRTTAAPTPEPVVQHLSEPKRSGGRLRSPAPSPIPSPVASPSPTRSRFQVSRVSESDSPVTPPSTSPNTFFGSGTGSRFKVTVVDYPPVNSTPTPVIAGNNVTIGFETSSTLTLSPTPVQIASALSNTEPLPSQTLPSITTTSPSPSPTPSNSSSSVCSVVTCYKTIPLLFPTPMPSPMPSPAPSPSYVPPENSPFEESLVNDNITTSEILPNNKSSLEPPNLPLDNKSLQGILNPHDVLPTDIIDNSSNIINIQDDLTERRTHNSMPDLDNVAVNKMQSEVPSSPSVSVTSHDSVSFSREKKFRSDSEESDKEVIVTKSRLPKATDSLDLSALHALHALKQPSISVVEKPTQRSRKISWVQPSSMFSAVTSQDDTSKPPSSLERLLSLFNPFSRQQKTEEEPQLQSVPELSEKIPQQIDSNVLSVSEPKHFSVTHTVDKIVQSISEMSVSSCLSSVNNQLENSAEKQTNCEQDSFNFKELKTVVEESILNTDLKSNNCTPIISTCAPTFLETNSSETKSELKSANIRDNLNNNETCAEADNNEIKCETWPQGRTSLAKINVIHQSQSNSAPCLAALVLLQSNVTSDLSVDIKKLSPTQSEDTMDATKNITWAL